MVMVLYSPGVSIVHEFFRLRPSTRKLTLQ